MSNQTKIIDLEGGVSPTKKRKVHLKTARQCRAFLSKITNELYAGGMIESKAGRIAYIINILLRAIEVETIEKKLFELEAKVNDAFERKNKPY